MCSILFSWGLMFVQYVLRQSLGVWGGLIKDVLLQPRGCSGIIEFLVITHHLLIEKYVFVLHGSSWIIILHGSPLELELDIVASLFDASIYKGLVQNSKDFECLSLQRIGAKHSIFGMDFSFVDQVSCVGDLIWSIFVMYFSFLLFCRMLP